MLNNEMIQNLKEAKIKYNECFSEKLIGYKVDNNIFVVPDESYIKDDIVLNKAEKVNVYIPNILLSNITDEIIKTRIEKVDFSELTKKKEFNTKGKPIIPNNYLKYIKDEIINKSMTYKTIKSGKDGIDKINEMYNDIINK